MKRAGSAALLALLLGLPAAAEDLDCAALVAGLRGIQGYELTVPPAGPADGWCVLDGAVLRSQLQGWPNISATEMRLKGEGRPLERIDAEVTGLRIAPRLGDTTIDEKLRGMFRLQDGDLSLSLRHDSTAGIVVLDQAELRLSGGTVLVVSAEIAAEGLAPAALANGLVTSLQLEWRTDGRLLRPVMELLGERLTGATGGQAVDVARRAFAAVVAALPDAALAEDARNGLESAVADQPQGRGRLKLLLTSPEGIGAARLAVLALSSEPLGEAALARLFAGALITAEWQPGLAP